ncbi:META domain-containing protein [Sphingobacterium shayense]|uniref:META domain-containing protein n=1 Tax=Sphingobacterium shayense TaxID=626343 RepID=UPI0015573520|nr:META domain-containing protein [Sphingobacterium shayense]NQD71392.1 META domain-containing protein [Sphingobacterium shayense]
MKRMRWGYLVICTAILVGCATKKNTMTNDDRTQLLGKKWQLVELSGNPVAEKINGKTPYLELLTEGNRYSASGGCNGIGGEYELLKNHGIKFERGMSTMMACPDMTIEQGLGKLFETADSYTVSDSALTFSSKGALLAKFKIFEQAQNDLAGTWELDYIMEAGSSLDTLFPVKKPSMTFDVANNKVSGNGGCNRFNGSVVIEGSTLKFGPVMSTKMACPGTAENVFFKNLERVTSFSTNDAELTLIADDIVVMRLKKS